ncbi:MAG: alpha/beta fold hydrolase [Parvularculaceae bacterium]
MKKEDALILTVVALSTGPAAASPQRSDEPQRSDGYVTTADGLRIFLRRIVEAAPAANRGPLLLVNGGRPGVLASWDVDVPGPSTAALFAAAGHTVYLMDARGFGRSAHTPEMRDGAEAGPVAVRTDEVVNDGAAGVAEIKRRHPGDDRLAALGWATGSQWVGAFAAGAPDAFSHLIYYHGAYGGAPGGWPFQSVADPSDPTALDRARFDAFRCSTAAQATGRLAEETDDAAFLARYGELALEGDRRADERDPPCFRFPSGPLADTLAMVNGRKIFDAGPIRGKVLILRAENDFWSRPEDVRALRADLRNAASVDVVELPGASHYAHLSPEARGAFVDAVLAFTAADAPEGSSGRPQDRP